MIALAAVGVRKLQTHPAVADQLDQGGGGGGGAGGAPLGSVDPGGADGGFRFVVDDGERVAVDHAHDAKDPGLDRAGGRGRGVDLTGRRGAPAPGEEGGRDERDGRDDLSDPFETCLIRYFHGAPPGDVSADGQGDLGRLVPVKMSIDGRGVNMFVAERRGDRVELAAKSIAGAGGERVAELVRGPPVDLVPAVERVELAGGGQSLTPGAGKLAGPMGEPVGEGVGQAQGAGDGLAVAGGGVDAAGGPLGGPATLEAVPPRRRGLIVSLIFFSRMCKLLLTGESELCILVA